MRVPAVITGMVSTSCRTATLTPTAAAQDYRPTRVPTNEGQPGDEFIFHANFWSSSGHAVATVYVVCTLGSVCENHKRGGAS